MKILVTGGSGFIGSYFFDALARLGHELVILDLVDPPPSIRPARFVRGDVRDAAAVRDALSGCDAVLHLAAAHHDFGIDRPTYFSVNEGAARVLCAACDEAGVRDVCFYSTVAVYGDAPEPHTEDAPCEPTMPYGESKLAGERVFEAWAGDGGAVGGGGRRCLVIRPTVTFGPRNFANMYSLIRQVRSGKFVRVGSGDNIKSLSYVENIVDATLYLWGLDPSHAGKGVSPGFHVYNWIDKPDLTSRQITEAVYRSLGKKPPGFAVPMWLALLGALPFDIVIKLTGKNLPVSSARVKKLFAARTKYEADKVRRAGFSPRVTLTEGIDRMVKWYLAEGKDQKAVWHIPPPWPGERAPEGAAGDRHAATGAVTAEA